MNAEAVLRPDQILFAASAMSAVNPSVRSSAITKAMLMKTMFTTDHLLLGLMTFAAIDGASPNKVNTPHKIMNMMPFFVLPVFL